LPGTISNLITVSVVQVLFQWMNLISKIWTLHLVHSSRHRRQGNMLKWWWLQTKVTTMDLIWDQSMAVLLRFISRHSFKGLGWTTIFICIIQIAIRIEVRISQRRRLL
jgi:hypothetical protein